MKTITKETLKVAANKLLFDMNDEQYQTLLDEFATLQQQMELIGKIEGVDEAKPMVFPFNVTNSFLREDVPSESLDRDEALKNASDVVDGQIRLPKVVG